MPTVVELPAQTGFVECEHCHAHLTPAHLVKSVSVPASVPQMAVVLHCTICQGNTRLVVESSIWEDIKKAYEAKQERLTRVLEQAHGEVMAIEILADLQEIWSKNAPLREAVIGACGCDACKKRRYFYAT